MDTDGKIYIQGMQDRRTDTFPEPVHAKDLDISEPMILEEKPYRNRRSPIIVEFGKVAFFNSSNIKCSKVRIILSAVFVFLTSKTMLF